MALDPNLEILTDRCRLRYPNEADIPYVWSASQTPGFNEGVAWPPPAHMEELRERLRRSWDAWANGKFYGWTAERRADAAFLGRIDISRGETPGQWSIGFWIHPSHQRHGYAVEIASAMVGFGFRELKAEVITAAHEPWNAASAKVLARIGMIVVQPGPGGLPQQGGSRDLIEYEIRRS
jgi:ribosomal-protein-alanine N-acetyltransferase